MHNEKPKTMSCSFTRTILFAIVGVVLFSAALLGLIATQVFQVNLTNEELNVRLEEKVLCPAQSVVRVIRNADAASTIIPANAAITKIYASILETGTTQIDNGTIEISDDEGSLLFALDFPKDPNSAAVFYETTFVQPLCVGESDATVELTSFAGDNQVPADRLVITIVYCPDYCVEE